MNVWLTIGVGLYLSIVLSVLGAWNRMIRKSENKRLYLAIKEAEEEGTNQALTQHPVIDLNRCVGCGSCVRACPEHGVLVVVDAKARLAKASHCVGHGLCETACPVGALTVGLGDVSAREDIPILSAALETVMPGVFIAGELGGIGLIRNAITQGTQVVETVAGRLSNSTAADDSPHATDLLIVGCGPTGIAASMRAHELGIRHLIIDQSGIGGSVRKYPRGKMTLTQPVHLPVYGRMKRSHYTKEELIELWEKLVCDTGVEIRSGVKLTGLEQTKDGRLVAQTSDGPISSQYCLLAIGRRGTPRTLGVPGEESERVLYQLMDAVEHQNQHLLVVGGGDSAIEAALALATQPGNRIVLSYRRHAFFRIKPRNRELLDIAVADERIQVLFNSEVRQIADRDVVILVDGEEQKIPFDFMFVLAGGVPPFPLLKSMGIEFGGVDRTETATVGGSEVQSSASSKQKKMLVLRTWILVIIGVSCFAFFAYALSGPLEYYQLSRMDRVLHSSHEQLRSSGRFGLLNGMIAAGLFILNLGYLIRKRWIHVSFFGPLRMWMDLHVLTGFIGGGLILFHSALTVSSVLGALAVWTLLATLVTGIIGRTIYIQVPRSLEGKELEFEQVRNELQRYRLELEDGGVNADWLIQSERRRRSMETSLVGCFVSLFVGYYQRAREYRLLKQRLLKSKELKSSVRRILPLAKNFCIHTQWMERYYDLRGLLSSWRFFHRWLAILMLVAATGHILIALFFGDLHFSGGQL